MNNVIFRFLILLILFNQEIIAQTDTPFKHVNLAFREYINLVKTNNLEYAAEKLNISISEAAIESAKIFPDPYFAIDMTQNFESGTKNGYGYESELINTFETGGKRRARISLMNSEYELTKAQVADYYRNLQADATLVYLEAMKLRQLYDVRNNSYETMKKLYEADSVRLMLGTIMEIDALQSKLEAGIIFNELIRSMAEWKNSLAQVSVMAGLVNRDTLFIPVSHLHVAEKDFLLDNLIATAVNNRSDLLAARLNKDVSEKNLFLAKKERMIDLNFKLGLDESYLQKIKTPSNTGITAGIEVPLKISNIYKGDIKMAQARIAQAEELSIYAELQIRTEIIKAWELYMAYCMQVENFDNGLLENAENVRKGKIYSYQRGETSLLEVLNAQRTFNEIQTAYYEAHFNRASALVELERSAGIWDIDF